MEATGAYQGYRMILLLLTTAFPFPIGSETRIISEMYQQLKEESGLKFTRVLLSHVQDEVQCFLACNLDTTCVRVGIQGKFHCFKMTEDSSGNALLEDELVYLKGTFIGNNQ